jgi:hypothetical protein
VELISSLTLRTSILALMVFLILVPQVAALSSEDVETKLGSVFSEIRAAEYAGGDVSGLIPRFNEALRLAGSGSSADLAAADTLLTQIDGEAQSIYAGGVSSTNTQYISVAVTLVLLCAGTVLVWRFGSELIWGVWARMKAGWVVKAR